MKFIATALGDDVENTTGRLAVFSTIGAGFDFNFLHELERQVGAGSTERRVSRVHAIENVVVLGTGRTSDRRIAIATRGVTQT